MIDLNEVWKYSSRVLIGVNDPVGDSIAEHGRRVYLQLKQLFAICNHANNEIVDKMLATALLHDVLEDTSQTEKDLSQVVGHDVIEMVKELTISFEGKDIKEAVAPLTNISLDAYLVKMSDMLDTARKTLFYIEVNTKKWYETFYFPLVSEFEKMNKSYLRKMKGYRFEKEARTLNKEFNTCVDRLRFFVENYREGKV